MKNKQYIIIYIKKTIKKIEDITKRKRKKKSRTFGTVSRVKKHVWRVPPDGYKRAGRKTALNSSLVVGTKL